MYASPGRLWQVIVGASLAFHLGCQHSPSPTTTLGNLPQPKPHARHTEINATTYFAHAHLLERQGQFERAAGQYRRALALQPELVAARNRLGITLNKLGQHSEATAQFRSALAKHPAAAHLYNNLGFSLYLEGEYEQAEAALRRALELNPDFARAHLNRALALARLNRLDETFAELKQAGCEADAHFNMGVILIDAEQYENAGQYLEAALAIRPDFDAARQQLGEVTRLAAEARARRAALAAAAEEETPESTGEAVAGATGKDETDVPSAEDATQVSTANYASESPETAAAGPSSESLELVVWDSTETIWLDYPDAPSAPSGGGTHSPEFAQEPGIDAELLFAMINEALAELRNPDPVSFDPLWCQIGYYLFPETAPEVPEPWPERWLVDQRDLLESGVERPVGK